MGVSGNGVAGSLSAKSDRLLALRTLQKLALLVLVFVLASFFLHLAVNALPGDPIALRMKNPDPEKVAQLREQLGLEQPFLVRYGHYVTDFLTLDWGRSLISGRPVVDEIGEFFPATLELVLVALLVGVSIGLVTAFSARWLQWPALRTVSLSLGAVGLTVPIFWLGLIFIVIGSYALGWFPVGGRFDFANELPNGRFFVLSSITSGRLDLLVVALHHLALPVLTLALYPAALVCGVLQARLHDPQLTFLLRALKAKGLAPWQIWFKHVLRLMSAPVITVLGTNLGALLGGAVLTETVFSWPGMGRYLVAAVLNRDLFVIENGLLLVVLLAFVSVSLADLAALVANPILRSGVRPV